MKRESQENGGTKGEKGDWLRTHVGIYFSVLTVLTIVIQGLHISWLTDVMLILTPIFAIGYLLLLIKENKGNRKIVRRALAGAVCIGLLTIAFPLWLLNL